MKLPAIKKLVETYQLEQLRLAEEAILEEKQPGIEVEGEDEGEQLTHVSAAIWIIEEIQSTGDDIKTALRKYAQRVRGSIG